MLLRQRLLIVALRVIYRPTVMKLAQELSAFYNDMIHYVAQMELKPEVVKRALEVHRSAISEDSHQIILNEILEEVSVKFTDLMRERQLTLKASLLSTKDTLTYYEMVGEIKKNLFPRISSILMIRLVNAMAELDFKKVFGCTREEWDKSHREQDVLDPLIDAIKEKQPLPEEIRKVLEEVNAIVPLDFDYDSIN